ncbi:MAG: tRNA (adenosine(37)-N6)-threonylcarbamoyltransferase complex transferase subunit TsaD, partial [Pseudomonadota bacterium]
DLCAGFQAAVVDVLVEKSKRAIEASPGITGFAVAGGVAANTAVREGLSDLSSTLGVEFVAPPLAYCTDNAAMIAWAGAEAFLAGRVSDMTLAARPRWPLDQTAPALLGSGKKGAKA